MYATSIVLCVDVQVYCLHVTASFLEKLWPSKWVQPSGKQTLRCIQSSDYSKVGLRRVLCRVRHVTSPRSWGKVTGKTWEKMMLCFVDSWKGIKILPGRHILFIYCSFTSFRVILETVWIWGNKLRNSPSHLTSCLFKLKW